MSTNGNVLYGRALLDMIASQVPAMGDVHVVMSTSDVDSYNYDTLQNVVKPDDNGFVRFHTSLADAYAAVQSGNNDVIVLDGHSTHALSGMLTWSKSRVNVFGMDGGGRLVQQGAKVQISGAVAAAAVLKVTGTRNSFRNIKFIQASTDATALNVVQFAGEGNVYEDCSFIFGVADNLDSTSATEALVGEDSGTFRRCSFGTDVLLTSVARAVVTLDAISGASSADGAKSNRFIDCEHIIMSSSADALLLKLADTAGAKFLNRWVRPSFIAVVSAGGGGIAVTNAIASATSFVDGSLVFENPVTANCTSGCAGVTANVVITGAPVFTANAWEGGTPS